jgi:hypothetical protein
MTEMTIARVLPLHVHGAFETVLAVAMMAAAFVLGLDSPALIASLALGGLILTVALATHADDERSLPTSTHLAFDLAFAIAMASAAVAFAAVGNGAAGLLLATGSLSLLLLVSLTRWSSTHA